MISLSASPADAAVRLSLLDAHGVQRGCLELSLLPGLPFLLTDEADGSRHPSAPRVRVREAARYRYRVDSAHRLIRIGPAELLSADDDSQLTGRVTTGEYVGEVEFEVDLEGIGRAMGRVDILPTKIGDEASFQSMLSDLAALSVEALHQGFAPSAGTFGRGAGGSPQLLYQRFAVLYALLATSELNWAFAHLLGEPHRTWVQQEEQRRPGTPVRGTSSLARSLTRPGPRVPALGPRPHVPVQLVVDKTEETVDTLPNRYVRFVLEQWRALALAARSAAGTLTGSAASRGERQATEVVDKIDGLLSQSLFRQVGRLSAFPHGNTVLQSRDGYRQVSAAAALVESTLGLELEVEPFLVSRRSIALLYEHWTFVRLARAVATACGNHRTPDLFEVGEAGMSLVLRSGRHKKFVYEAEVQGVQLLITLSYNETFGTGRTGGSWTKPMRPDASLMVQPLRLQSAHQRHYLHFDAKYRLDLARVLAEEPDESDSVAGVSKREDLLKMHAYRDAIRGSAAAYVMYPGSGDVTEFAWAPGELLPGLGAIPLRPDRADADTAKLSKLVSRLLHNVASDSTRYNRSRYWEAAAYAGPGADRSTGDRDLLVRPPADTPVLLGYVRSPEQWRWILQQGLYNVRGDGRRGSVQAGSAELDVVFLVLYGHTGSARAPVLMRRLAAWRAMDRVAMLKVRYPHPRGDAYLVAAVEPVLDQPAWIERLRPDDIPRPGAVRAPFTRTWLELAIDAPPAAPASGP